VVRRLNDDAVTNSGGSISHFATAVVAQVLERDQGRAFDAYLAHLRQLYKRHCAALCAALRRHMPQCSFLEPTGGYFLWLRLPPSTRVSARQLAKVARAHFGVGFRHGAQCGVDTSGDVFDSALRLCFAHLPEPQLDEAVRRLAAAVAAVETEAAKD
jgi:DNA-binding transcriptional MocR family regulator